ncbi:hypothetical protein DM860_014345 [Cuscuta australis]|uniref:Fungal lipase-like domain-containing protein n=2 Tax=Cuscuta sect. Cleistogrammica TaxID=1824901 RepID=A0A328DE85_9ASTE|nr:hypothetical protein DM860_014345 [Cuscuta australis]
MATATMATAAGAAALLYYTLNRKLLSSPETEDVDDDENEGDVHSSGVRVGAERVSRKLIQAPATWLETISTLSETLRFTYSETLGKWPIGDLAFGISFLLKRQGNIHVSSIFGSEGCTQLKGPEIASELRNLLNLLTLCWHFSKKPFPLFLEETGYSQESVLLQEPKAGILKPAFTILVDHSSKSFLLLIRGTHSVKDTLTAATGAVVPFHHSVVHEGGVSNLVLGYAHCGMVAAARWIAKLSTPSLISALGSYPDYKIKIVGHSLGGGTAALLTYVLREQKELSRSTCVTFAPAACMTWELAESGTEFITSVINGADLVPTFSAASVDDLRAEVTASAWLNDLRNQIEHTRILSTVYRSASAIGSRLPSIATAKAKVAGAGAILRPVSSGTQVVMRRAQSMAHAALSGPAMRLSSWSCVGPRRRPSTTFNNNSNNNNNNEHEASESSSSRKAASEPLIGGISCITEVEELPVSSWDSGTEISIQKNLDDDAADDDFEENGDVIAARGQQDHMTEVQMWQQLEQELYDKDGGGTGTVKEIREEEAAAIAEVGQSSAESESSVPDTKEAHRFFPPGRIMHIVTLAPDDQQHSDDASNASEDDNEEDGGEDVGGPEDSGLGIFLTPRTLYSKIRLSQTMISDHFMPVYRRQIEKLIKKLDGDDDNDAKKESSGNTRCPSPETIHKLL